MNHHYFSNKDMAWDWKPVLNNNPYTFIEWGIISLYGIFLYKLTNMVVSVNKSVIDKDIEDTSVIDKDIEDTSTIETDTSKTQKPRCIIVLMQEIIKGQTSA